MDKCIGSKISISKVLELRGSPQGVMFKCWTAALKKESLNSSLAITFTFGLIP